MATTLRSFRILLAVALLSLVAALLAGRGIGAALEKRLVGDFSIEAPQEDNPFLVRVEGWTVEAGPNGQPVITLPVHPSHHVEHDSSNPATAELVSTVLASWQAAVQAHFSPEPPDNNGQKNLRCAVMKVLGYTARYYIWQETHISTAGIARGNLVWWNAAARDIREVRGISNFSGNSFGKLPDPLKNEPGVEITEYEDCYNFPYPPGGLATQ